jgi:hypothetical protein
MADEEMQSPDFSGIYRWSSASPEADTGLQIQKWKIRSIGMILEIDRRQKRSLRGLVRDGWDYVFVV